MTNPEVVAPDRQVAQMQVEVLAAEVRGAMSTFAVEIKSVVEKVSTIAVDLKEATVATRETQLAVERMRSNFVNLQVYETRHKELEDKHDRDLEGVNHRLRKVERYLWMVAGGIVALCTTINLVIHFVKF